MPLKEILRITGLPVLQNRMFKSRAEALASATGDVVLIQDEHTGLIYNASFDPSRIVYDRDYQNEQAHSSIFRQHLDQIAGIMAQHFSGKRLIEVGCGKGYFLERLQADGFNITGIDPAYEGASPSVVKEPFTKKLGLSGDGIILRHVLEHVPDPVSFLREIARANGGGGTIYIEVPSFDWIVHHHAWFDFFYEHVNYFRPSDFSRMFGRIYETGRVFGGQYFYVLADLSDIRTPVRSGDDHVKIPANFWAGIDRAVDLIKRTPQRKHVVWGAASKGAIFSIHLRRAGIVPDQVIDINPAKQGRYLAVSGLKVSSPEEALPGLSSGDNIFVMNSIYLKEIISQSDNRFTYIAVELE